MTRLPLSLAACVLLSGCDDDPFGKFLSNIGAKDVVSEARAEVVPAAFVALSEPEPAVVETPEPVWETVCWIEWHRAGTMAVEVCENRLVSG